MWRGCSCRFNSSDDVESHIHCEHLSYVICSVLIVDVVVETTAAAVPVVIGK